MTFFLRIILKRTSTEAHVYMRRHQGGKVEHFDVSNVIYHKFSHGAFSYTLSGETIKVMLELMLSCCWGWQCKLCIEFSHLALLIDNAHSGKTLHSTEFLF